MTLKEPLAKHQREGHGWIASGDLQRLPWKDSRGNLVTPSNISRRLRELAAEGVLQVRHAAVGPGDLSADER